MAFHLNTHPATHSRLNDRRVITTSRAHSLGFVIAVLEYFGLVFGIGFLLGVIRVLWIVPLAGLRNAELLEQPFMLAAIFVAARWIVQHPARELSRLDILRLGLLALLMLILAEVFVALFIQPDRPRDRVSGIVYLIMLGVFALMPWFLSTVRGKKSRLPFAR